MQTQYKGDLEAFPLFSLPRLLLSRAAARSSSLEQGRASTSYAGGEKPLELKADVMESCEEGNVGVVEINAVGMQVERREESWWRFHKE